MTIRLSPVELLRLTSSAHHPVRVQEGQEKSEILKRLLALQPSRPWDASNVLATPLRHYQILGFDWLRFLFENQLAGLLCDDMGLGKTHQAMALMVWLRTFQAGLALQAGMKLGLTGTPIENSLDRLKSLFDLVLPGYFGVDKEFADLYGIASAGITSPGENLDALRRVVSPFVLRRLKKAVLDELPDKIEDVRACQLSEEQIKLYRDAIAARGVSLAERLKRSEQPVPYIHVFGLLMLLKQICDHPALVAGGLEDFEKHQSGKWELFQELLFESLDSGQKVVVFTQYQTEESSPGFQAGYRGDAGGEDLRHHR